jgi:hypothetical protein
VVIEKILTLAGWHKDHAKALTSPPNLEGGRITAIVDFTSATTRMPRGG